MIELSIKQIKEISGGVKLNVGTAIFGAIAGFIMGGPVGVGIALGVVIGGHGINGLEEMYYEEFGKK